MYMVQNPYFLVYGVHHTGNLHMDAVIAQRVGRCACQYSNLAVYFVQAVYACQKPVYNFAQFAQGYFHAYSICSCMHGEQQIVPVSVAQRH
jgi:hypothetical protein